MGRVVFVRSLADGRFGCFHFLAVVNCAALDICVQVLWEHVSSFLLGRHLGAELLDLWPYHFTLPPASFHGP